MIASLHPLDNATNTHDLLIKLLMAEAGLLNAEPINPVTAGMKIALSYKRISTMIAKNWKNSENKISFKLPEKKIEIQIGKKQDSRLILVVHHHLDSLSEKGIQSPETYLTHAIYPSITYMLNTNREVKALIDQMILAEPVEAMRKFAINQVLRITAHKVTFDI
jgi:hypothetical protein